MTPRKPLVLAIILVAYFMILLDNSVIFTGLPSIRARMELTPTGLSWVQDAYTLTFGGFLLLAARSGDILGRRRMFMVGLVIFTVASALVGAAPSGGWLIAARALQGVGAAVVAPASLSLLTATFPEGPERHRAVAWYGATAGIGSSLGLVIGGALAHWISWRAGFFINLPIGVALIVVARRHLSETPRQSGRFDVIGALSATLGVGAVVFGIISSAEYGWDAGMTLGPIAAGLVLVGVLVFNESRAEQPIMPLRLFRSRERAGAYAARLLFLGGMIGFFYFTTQYLQDVLGWTPLQAGIGFFPMTVVNFAVALAVPRLVRRLGNAIVLAAGVLVTAIGMAALAQLGADTTYLVGVALPMVLIGAGQGLAFAPLTSAGIAGVSGPDAGAASGLINTFHQLGMSLGLAVVVAYAADLSDPTEHIAAALSGSAVLLASAFVVALAVIVPARRDSSRMSARRR